MKIPSAQWSTLVVSAAGTTHIWDGTNIVLDISGGTVNKYIRGINLLAADMGGKRTFYHCNGHGDVVVLTWKEGVGTSFIYAYDYDAFGNLKGAGNPDNANPWRYCGEYFDLSSGTYYLRARYFDPVIGRFLTEDTHWNPSNMIYGDNPVKWNEREPDENDPLGFKTYTHKPDIAAIMQSGNLYEYCMGNPVMYVDPSGKFVLTLTAALLFSGAKALIATGATAVVAGAIYDTVSKSSSNSSNRGVPVAPSQSGTGGSVAPSRGDLNSGVLVANKYGKKSVSEVLKTKKGSIKNAPLPPGGPSWDKLLPLSMETIRQLAQKGEKSYKEIWKLLTDSRFDRYGGVILHSLSELISFLDRLEDSKIYYRLNKTRDSIMVEITVPGQRWEVEYLADGTVEIEKFISEATIFDAKELELLFCEFSN